MAFAKAFGGARGAARAMVLIACGGGLAGCDTLASINPFDRSEKYKMEIVPEVPAEQIYNQGLARLEGRDFEGAAKKFADLDKQYPYSEWSRKALIMTAYSHFEGGTYPEAISTSKRYLQLHPASKDAAYAQYPDGLLLLQPDPRRDARSGADRARRRRLAGADRPLSEIRIRRRTRATRFRSPRTSSPARRWRSGASTSSAATTPPRSTASATSSASTRPPVTSRRR
jgi:hypothetical protein